MELPPHERFAICPYNSTHVVVAKRIGRHLVKCRLTHPTNSTSTCRFNVSHVFPHEDLKLHELNCPDRILVDRFVHDYVTLKQKQKEDADWTETNENHDNNASGLVSFNPLPTKNTKKSKRFDYKDHEECWDDDKTPTYNPHQAIAERNKNDFEFIMTHVQHGTPSERRRIRDLQRLEYQKFEQETKDVPPKKNEPSAKEKYEALNAKRGGKKTKNCFVK